MMEKHQTIVNKITEEFRSLADPEVKKSGERFFKEEVVMHGLRNIEVKRISAAHFSSLEIKEKKVVFDICTLLWKTGYMEEAFVACDWSFRVKKHYSQEDITLFEYWVNNFVNNWATCDTLCNHTVGTVTEKFPENIKVLKKWAHSENRWAKRAAAVSLIVQARKGLFRSDIFEIAEILLEDRDDMVQKGYGWMLKAASQYDVNDVFRFVTDRKKSMPRTAYRYAIEKMPDELRKKAMEK